jgi:hypothetical protein
MKRLLTLGAIVAAFCAGGVAYGSAKALADSAAGRPVYKCDVTSQQVLLQPIPQASCSVVGHLMP